MVSPGSMAALKIKGPGVLDPFPSCRLMMLNEKNDRKYLGITTESKVFSLEDISIKYLFVELYKETCSECIEEVKTFKSFYNLVKEKQELKNRIRILGIGAGSKKRKVVRFRQEQGIPFPLFADEDYELFKCLGNPTLPVSYLLKMGKERHKILMVQSGHVGSGEKLFRKVLSIIEKESKE